MRLAVIGLGSRAVGLVREMMRLDGEVKLAAVVDPNAKALPGRLKDLGFDQQDVRRFESVEPWLEEADTCDAILVGTRCDLHAPVAVKVAATHLPMLLEKPIAIDLVQLRNLYEAYKDLDTQMVVSFPLRFTPMFTTVLEIVRSGRLGTINQVQAINNVPYGGVYYSQFYREHDITHGLWLQKATHDFDYINLLTDGRPVRVAATSTQKIFGGDKPHDLVCSACDETETCRLSPRNLTRGADPCGIGFDDHLCVYGDRIRNQDAGSAMVEYENRINTCYSQNFVSRRSAGRRGAIITGFDATVEFDWYTETVRVVDHFQNRVDTIKVAAPSGHMGGDEAMLMNFLDVVAGKAESFSPLRAGLLSVAMCLAADESCRSNAFEDVPMLEEILGPNA